MFLRSDPNQWMEAHFWGRPKKKHVSRALSTPNHGGHRQKKKEKNNIYIYIYMYIYIYFPTQTMDGSKLMRTPKNKACGHADPTAIESDTAWLGDDEGSRR